MRALLTKIVMRGSLAALVVACAAGGAAAQEAVTLEGYRANVREAAGRLEELASLYEQTATTAGDERWRQANPGRDPAQVTYTTEARTLADARALLPPTLAVRWEGGTLAVSNAWLHEALDAYAKTAAAGPNAERGRRVREIVERLRAVESRLGEGAGREAAARDKEAEKGRLAGILRGPEFSKQAAKGGAITDLLERLQKWIASLFEGRGPSRGPGTGVATGAQVLIFALAFGVFAYVLWHFWRTRGGALTRVSFRREPRVILGETVGPDESPADLLAEAERLARGGDLRGAIRKAYVALLLELGDRNVLRLARHKTNREYLNAVRQLAPQLHVFMQPLTLSFERYWYGHEPATEDDWRDFLANCRRTLGAE